MKTILALFTADKYRKKKESEKIHLRINDLYITIYCFQRSADSSSFHRSIAVKSDQK